MIYIVALSDLNSATRRIAARLTISLPEQKYLQDRAMRLTQTALPSS